MPSRKQTLWWIASFLLTLVSVIGVWGYSQAPVWITEYAAERYPYITLHEIELGYPKIKFHNVEVNKPWVKGILKVVVVDLNKNIWVQGGDVTVSLDNRSESTQTSKSSNLQEVFLDKVQITYKTSRASVEDLQLRDDSYCIERGLLWVEAYIPSEFQLNPPIQISKACIKKDQSAATAQSMTVQFTLPHELPRLEKNQIVVFSGVQADISNQSLNIASFKFGKEPFVQGDKVEVTYQDQVLRFTMGSVKTDHPWVAPTEKTLTNVEVLLSKEGASTLIVEDASLVFDLEARHIQGEQSCSEWVAALPQPLAPALQDKASNFTGTLKFEVQAKPFPHIEIKHDCKYKCSESPIKELKGVFEYQAYDKDGELFTRTAGSGTEDWAPLELLPINVPEAFIRLEDPSFARHKGLLLASLRVALLRNLSAGEFKLGGSTITQQLAKNLWLRRHKTVGRKVEEAFLTMALESCLPKNKILELYLNVVEFGDDLYGIGPATEHYFEHSYESLSLDEAYYLARLLPNPRQVIDPNKGGLLRARNYMEYLAKKGMISEHLVPSNTKEDLSGWETVD